MIRRALSVVLRYSPLEFLNDLVLWPVTKRLFGTGYEEVVSVDKGVSIRVYGDMEDMVNKVLLFRSAFCKLAWEPVTARFIKKMMLSKRCVVIAGAHIGYYPLIASMTNPKAEIFTFEPNPFNFSRLVENIKLNNTSNINVFDIALGDAIGNQKMFFDFGQSSLVDSRSNHSGEGMVEVNTLDNFFADKEILPDLMIFDAEGYEPNILRGADEMLDKAHPDLIFELNPKSLRVANSSPEQLASILIDKGYFLFVIDDDYHHRLNTSCNYKIRLRSFYGGVSSNISFVNVFATIHTKQIEQFL